MPGGAPMNVAYHLQQLGHPTALITRIGNDARGKELLRRLAEKNIDTHLIQIDQTTGTGIVNATQSANGDMTYKIEEPAAWDYISLEAGTSTAVSDAGYFVYGSLAARHAMSRETLLKLLPTANKRVLDVNLRPPFIDQSLIEQLLLFADILKLNEDELNLISGWYDSLSAMDEKIVHLSARFNIPTIIVTRGANGCKALVNGEWFQHGGIAVHVADTVGSGDSFLAAFLSSVIKGDDIAIAINNATRLGAFVATHHGAWPAYHPDEIPGFNQG